MTNNIRSFSEVAELFCVWVESKPTTAEKEAIQARSLLISLYAAALLLPLPDAHSEELQSDPVPDNIWQQAYKRSSALPFSNYSAQIDPFILPQKEPEIADLADDLADIYRDILRGLFLYRKGQEEQAAWEWSFTFASHWGHHCISALYALHYWIESKKKCAQPALAADRQGAECESREAALRFRIK